MTPLPPHAHRAEGQPDIVPTERTLAAVSADGSLKQRSLRGGAVTLTSRVLLFGIHMGGTMALARLLTPNDFGVFAMVTAMTGFAAIFKDLGLSYATIQRQNITQAQVSTLFWLNTLVGAILALLVAALAPAVAWFYHRNELLLTTVALAPTFVLSGLAIQHNALLSRQMRFGTKAVIDITAAVVGTLVGVVAALGGCRYWALVLQMVTVAAISAIGVWIASGWRPSWPVRNVGTRGMVHYGLNITGFEVTNYFARNLDNILIGRFCGSAVLGNYSKAYQLLMFPISTVRAPLNTVAMPVLSRLQESPERYRAYYRKLLSVLAFVSMPIVVLTYVCAEELIHLLLGPQWSGAIILFRILAFAAFIQTVSGTRGLLLMSSGRGTEYFRWGLFNALVTTFGFAIGVRWGAVGVASAYVITNYAVLYPSIWYTCRRSPVRISDFFEMIARPTVASITMGVIITSVRAHLVPYHDLLVVAACASTSILAFLLLWMAIPGGIRELREYITYVKLLLGRSK